MQTADAKTFQEEQGKRGEKYLIQLLSKIPGAVVIQSSVILPTKTGGLTEIDAVLVHTSGVFVFENKEYSGSISGKISDRMWIKQSDTMITVANPVLQNKIHTKAVCAHLNLPENLVYSVIVFADSCDISAVAQNRADFLITNTSHLVSELAPHMNKAVLSETVRDDIARRLEKYAATDKSSQQHAKHIAEIKKEHKSEKKRGR